MRVPQELPVSHAINWRYLFQEHRRLQGNWETGAAETKTVHTEPVRLARKRDETPTPSC